MPADPTAAPPVLWVLVCGCSFVLTTGHVGHAEAKTFTRYRRAKDCNRCHQRPRLVRYERSEKP